RHHALALLSALAEGEAPLAPGALGHGRARRHPRVLLPEQRVLPVRLPVLARLHAALDPAARPRRTPVHETLLARRIRRIRRECVGGRGLQSPLLRGAAQQSAISLPPPASLLPRPRSPPARIP